MKKWNSFSRIKAVFNHEIPDRVPKYEGSIEIKKLNPIFDGQLDVRALLFFSPQQLSIFHRYPAIVSLLQHLIKHPRLFYPIAKIAPKAISKLPSTSRRKSPTSSDKKIILCISSFQISNI